MHFDADTFTQGLKSWLEQILQIPAHDESPNRFYLEGLEHIENAKIASAIAQFIHEAGFEPESPQEQTILILDRGRYEGFVSYSNFSGSTALKIFVSVGKRGHWGA